jgi:uncharacterized phage protein (TIGR02218 family)
MRTLPTGLQAHLDSGTTTLCYCWRVTRRDNTKLGFTDHDRDLAFDSTTFKADAGFTASNAQQSLGMSVDNMELVGALKSAAITEADLFAGRYDDAYVEIFQVNWQNTAQRIILMTGYVGEVTQNGIEFTAEMRSLSSRLNQKVGRVFQRTCDAVFGDARCGFNKASVTYTGTIVTVASPRSFVVSGLGAIASDWLSRGLLTWSSGPNSGVAYDVKVHTNTPSPNHTIELWTPCTEAPLVGNTFSVVAGCLQTADVCKSKFNNLANFRGFPLMPGNDIITTYPSQGGTNQTGGSRA